MRSQSASPNAELSEPQSGCGAGPGQGWRARAPWHIILAMRDLDERIEQATRHVEDGRRIIERQRERIQKGTVAPGALELLEQFEQSQAIFEAHLAQLLNERDGK
jgi:hypothetical protein